MYHPWAAIYPPIPGPMYFPPNPVYYLPDPSHPPPGLAHPPAATQIQHPTTDRDTRFYFEDGNCVIKIESQYMNLHRSILRQNSRYFDELFSSHPYTSPHQPNTPGSSDHHPITLQESLQVFRNLLSLIYVAPTHQQSGANNYPLTSREMAQVGQLAYKYRFDRVETSARQFLSGLSQEKTLTVEIAGDILGSANACGWNEVKKTLEDYMIDQIAEDDHPVAGRTVGKVLHIAEGGRDIALQARTYYAYLDSINWEISQILPPYKGSTPLSAASITNPGVLHNILELDVAQKSHLFHGWNTLLELRQRLAVPPALLLDKQPCFNCIKEWWEIVEEWWHENIADATEDRGPFAIIDSAILKCQTSLQVVLDLCGHGVCGHGERIEEELRKMRTALEGALPLYFGLK